jgi:AhpC/TSA family
MMARQLIGLALLLALTSACPTRVTTPPSDGDDSVTDIDADSEPIIPAEPANRSNGDELDATIPVIGGDSIELASLRGRPVLLEISASWEPGFAEAHGLYVDLLAAHPDLAVVVVVADPADASLDGLEDAFILAWDPAGALAAKLTVATMPTMFVVDRSGHISVVVNGWSDDIRATLARAVAAADQEPGG